MPDSYDKPTEEKERLYGRVMQYVNKDGLFSAANGVTVTKVAEDYAEGELIVSEHSMNPHGFVHGGCLTTLADTVAGSAVTSRGVICVTLNSSMNYLAPAKGTKKVRCVATPQKVGRTVCVYNVLLTGDAGQTIASGIFTFYILRKVDPDQS